jgi:hypothetical protein
MLLAVKHLPAHIVVQQASALVQEAGAVIIRLHFFH